MYSTTNVGTCLKMVDKHVRLYSLFRNYTSFIFWVTSLFSPLYPPTPAPLPRPTSPPLRFSTSPKLFVMLLILF